MEVVVTLCRKLQLNWSLRQIKHSWDAKREIWHKFIICYISLLAIRASQPLGPEVWHCLGLQILCHLLLLDMKEYWKKILWNNRICGCEESNSSFIILHIDVFFLFLYFSLLKDARHLDTILQFSHSTTAWDSEHIYTDNLNFNKCHRTARPKWRTKDMHLIHIARLWNTLQASVFPTTYN